MFSLLLVKYFEFLEHWHEKGFFSACRRALYRLEELVPVEKDLNALSPTKESKEGLDLVEITPHTFSSLQLEYPLRSRQKRAEYYFRRGYLALAMVHDGKVVGDVWYVSSASSQSPEIHPHVKWFGFNLSENDVYMFDMHVVSDQRGGGLGTFFLNTYLQYLHSKGYQKAFGSFAVQNVPALWVHRLIGYKEFPHYVFRRIFLYETGRPKI